MCDIPVSAIDIAPTILSAAGVGPQKSTEGVDLLDQQAVGNRRAIFGEVFTHNAVDIDQPASSLRHRWVLAGDWKLIVPDRRNEPDGRLELFDIVHDPLESKNLAAQRAETVAALVDKLDSWWPGRR
jgi:uncharacterized sulfatase